jgi:uncharacterized membrane protein/1-acyl-sn-glycerol-3-phosphate acyltransferase
MRTVKILFLCHLAALIFGLGGLLIALPHPELWSSSPSAGEVFNFGIRYAGSLHILFGAATMLLFGVLFIGTRKTLIFFVAATTISLSMELLGTSTGFPFGAYSYTSFLGIKVAGLVPYSIPLSWFYMGFTSYILASLIVANFVQRHSTAWSLVLGAYFLTVWDLVLDPAMASQQLPIHFWIWHQTGPYFGMPISNLVGWSLTGLIYMSLSRLLWHTNLEPRRIAVWLPLGIYAANMGFAIALDLSAGLWIPVLMAAILGLLPALLALMPRPTRGVQHTGGARNSIIKHMSRLTVHAASRAIVRRKVRVVVEGLEHVPATGPVLIAARHFHHLYDGGILLEAIPRKIHILVALDWVQKRWLRGLMEWACAMMDWPVMLRIERLGEDSGENSGEAYTGRVFGKPLGTASRRGGRGRDAGGGPLWPPAAEGSAHLEKKPTRENSGETSSKDSKAVRGVYSRGEFKRYLRRAALDSVRLLREGEALVVFPEAYPNIDPVFTPKNDSHDFLPFRPGFVRLAEMAERDGRTQVAIVPAGFTYVQNGQWHVTLRLGPALSRRDYVDSEKLVKAVEEQVRTLSGQLHSSVSRDTEEVFHL